MPLTKLRIENQDNRANSFNVLFNPTQFTLDEGSQWKEQSKPRYKSELQYTGWQRKSISMELFFDTYEAKTDVRQVTGEFAKLLIPTDLRGEQGKRPPKVRLVWGPADPHPTSGITNIDWVLEKLSQKFTLFTGDGMPVRATLNVTFKEFIPPKKVNQQNPRRGSFPEKTYTVKAGDTLAGVAAALWKDPTKWRIIAEHNGIDNPRSLEAGKILSTPAIK
jgi:hypothetical protein